MSTTLPNVATPSLNVDGGFNGEEVSSPHLEQEQKKPTPPPKFTASVFSSSQFLPFEFVQAVQALEKLVDMPIWLLLQNGGGPEFNMVDDDLCEALFKDRVEIPKKKPIAIFIDSPGGYAQCAYRFATMLRQRCGGFTAIVPRSAKSAATLLTLGADTILMGESAELGPLDAQIFDAEREDIVSALDEVQSLERLHAFALDAIDRTMLLLLTKTGKKMETLLPMILRFVTDMMRPLLEKIDTVHYTQMSRALKVAEEYAVRLLQDYYPLREARRIARHLVENYPEHGFFVGEEEARDLGLKVSFLNAEQQAIVDTLYPYLTQFTAIGRLKEEQKDDNQKS